mmetsp:Transcript_32710/g.97178  ORF Transcript_32710/g.97178 Transcript_32710/m.97178 type:complete len:277 (+) Transcript_32710:257-1087(+)
MEIFFLASSAQYFSGTPVFLSSSILRDLIFSSLLRSPPSCERAALPSSRKSRLSWNAFSSRAAICCFSSFEWLSMMAFSSVWRLRSASSCCICTEMMRSNSSRSNFACSPRRRSFSACCRSRATLSSLICPSFLSLSACSFRRASRSAASKARFARSASISEALSAAFSCWARSFAVSFSFSAATRAFSASTPRSRASLASTYSWMRSSSSLSASILSSLIFMAAPFASFTSFIRRSAAKCFCLACSTSSALSASICFRMNARSMSRCSSSFMRWA